VGGDISRLNRISELNAREEGRGPKQHTAGNKVRRGEQGRGAASRSKGKTPSQRSLTELLSSRSATHAGKKRPCLKGGRVNGVTVCSVGS